MFSAEVLNLNVLAEKACLLSTAILLPNPHTFQYTLSNLIMITESCKMKIRSSQEFTQMIARPLIVPLVQAQAGQNLHAGDR
jgi:hypothetical protein